MPRNNVRRAAVSALRAWSKGHLYAETLIDRHARRNHLSTADRSLLNSIVLGVLRHRRLLDHWIGELRRGRLDHETRDILRTGLCQLLVLGIADHAAVNETVACARRPVRGLINAVLRRAIAARKTLQAGSRELPPPLLHSHPDWLCNRWSKQFGKENARALLEWNNQPAPVYLRPHPRPGAHPEATLRDSGLVQAVAAAPGFFHLDGPLPEKWIREGLIYVQDPSTRHAVKLLAPRPGETILDACAAPGGKASLIAAAMKGEGVLHCTDSSQKRLVRLQHNLSALGHPAIDTAVFDWTGPAPSEWHRRFDAILLDVPCSNTGVFRRRVDARWRLQPKQLEELTALQDGLLANARPCLKPGGRLVYSTCSLESEENEARLTKFCATHPDWIHLDSHRSLPFRDGFDGAYAALLQAPPK